MKKALSTILIAICALTAQAGNWNGVTDFFENKEAGELRSAASIDFWKKTQSVNISGPINADDLRFLAEVSMKFQLLKINLKGATQLTQIPAKTFYANDIVGGEVSAKDSVKLEEITLPFQTEVIGDSAFMNCTHLSVINFNDSLKVIGAHAFDGCSAIEDYLEVPNNITTMKPYCFAHCTQLTGIILPQALKSIPEGCFFECSAMRHVGIQENVKSIGLEAFKDCKLLQLEIKCETPPVLDSWPFAWAEIGCTVCVPDKGYPLYVNHKWFQFMNIVNYSDYYGWYEEEVKKLKSKEGQK